MAKQMQTKFLYLKKQINNICELYYMTRMYRNILIYIFLSINVIN